MNQLSISVAEDLQDFINEQIKTKGYNNISFIYTLTHLCP